MSGVFGIDIQPTRTVIALVEASAGVVRVGPVGDGRRALVPNAVDATGWGSDARGANRPGGLYDWRADPWGEPFLAGLRDRLAAYVGGAEPTLAGGYPVALSHAGAGDGPDGATVRRRAAAAGLTDAVLLHPADALLGRWLTEPGTQQRFKGHVVVVACGETGTAIRGYDVDRAPDRMRIVRGADQHLVAGSHDWTTRVATEVLARCPALDHAPTPVALLDAVAEFGARLRGQPAHRELTWDGALAGRMISALRLSRAEMAQWDEVVRTTGAIAVALAGLPAPSLVVLGGTGAAWPFLADKLARGTSVWSSTEPGYDLAVGAAWWPAIGRTFTGALEPEAVATANAPVPAAAPPDRTPPWLRG